LGCYKVTKSLTLYKMPRRGRTRKKTRTHVVENDHAASALTSQDEKTKVPRSVVFRRGKVEAEVVELITDIRQMMAPYTALKFKEDPNRKMKLAHYAKELSGPMGVTHLMALSQNGPSLSLRIARTPIGPTLTFQLKRFSLSKQVRAIQRRPYNSTKAFSHPPIIVTNNFGDASAPAHVKLLRITFQGMFPAINVETVQLSNCRRVVLFNFLQNSVADEANHSTDNNDGQGDETVEVRHYAIRATPVGVHRRVRRLIEAKIPNLSKLQDISDYITGATASGDPAGVMSDSEAEDETAHVILPQNFTGRGNSKSQKSALKLVELGPRLRLRLMKVEKELGNGEVMYHAYVTKSDSEIKEKEAEIKAAAELKKRRREEQEANVAKKSEALEAKKQAKKRRQEEKKAQVTEPLVE